MVFNERSNFVQNEPDTSDHFKQNTKEEEKVKTLRREKTERPGVSWLGLAKDVLARTILIEKLKCGGTVVRIVAPGKAVMGSPTALDSSVAHELAPLICFGGITFIRIQPDVDKGLVTDVLP